MMMVGVMMWVKIGEIFDRGRSGMSVRMNGRRCGKSGVE